MSAQAPSKPRASAAARASSAAASASSFLPNEYAMRAWVAAAHVRTLEGGCAGTSAIAAALSR
jgi:hypothetical protein